MAAALGKILLATDGSEDATLAKRAAADLARETHAQLHVVHAWYSVPSTRFKAYIRSQLKQEAKELLASEVERLEEQTSRTVTHAHLVEGPAVDAILDAVEDIEPDLLVLGSRGHGLVQRLVMGSVSEGIVHHLPCPLLLLRGGEGAWPPERVIIGDDGSETSREAGELAARIGSLVGSKAYLVRAYPELPEMDEEERKMDARLAEDELRHEERSLVERAAEIEPIIGSHPKVRLAAGDAARILLDVAEEGIPEKALVAVGSRGLGMVRRTRLGSVSTKVLRAAKGPVLIHPQPRERRPR